MRSRTFGDLTLTAWSDGSFELPISDFPNALELGGVEHADRVDLGSTVWSIKTPTRTIMVDAGAGNALKTKRPATGRLAQRIAAHGDVLDPNAVTDIVLTHLHADHIGGLMDGAKRRFPNATLHVSEAEWVFWTDTDVLTRLPAMQRGMAMEVIVLVRSLTYDVDLHQGVTDLGEGITLHPAPGHTPGHTIVRLASGADQALLAADSLICGPMQLAHPRITYRQDIDSHAAVQTRLRLLDMVNTDSIPFVATHLKTLSFGYLDRAGDGYHFQPA